MRLVKNGAVGYAKEKKFMSKHLLLLFTRNPELGKVKTRLAKTIGDQAALDIYTFLLQHTQEVTHDLPCDKAVYYSVKVRENDIWSSDMYQKYAQEGDDLGARMQHAFAKGFAQGYEKIVIIGSDLYDLQKKHILAAFEALTTNDVVIGPAEDGGYYLLGMKTLHTQVFQHKEWGTDTVRQDTLNDLKDSKIHLLEPLNDIDVFEDIQNNPIFESFYKHS